MMRLLADLVLVLSVNPCRACTESGVLMARVRASGIFELLSAKAWASALGYAPEELSGKSLRDLMQLETRASAGLVGALLDHQNAWPLDVSLRCKDERRKRFRLHRRFDPYQDATYVVADELLPLSQ